MNLLRAIMPGLVVLLALGAGAPGQGDVPATATGTPKIVFAQPIHNFGELKPNAEVTHEFAFTNAGAWVEDQSTVNRATLHLAPLALIWMMLVVRTWLAKSAPAIAMSSAG